MSRSEWTTSSLLIQSDSTAYKMSVPTNEKDLSGRPGHLNETQQAAFDEFKSKVDSTHDQATRRWYDDTTLL
jgi:hypothetical protein